MTIQEPITFGHHLERAVPRYASYPTVASFHEGIGAAQHDAWLAALPEGARIAINLHIPFCGRLCWYCMCRTQAARPPYLVEAYLDALTREIARTEAALPPGVEIVRMTWRGGSPASLAPAQIARLARTLRARLPLAPDLDFGIEIDAAATGPEQAEAVIAAGMTRAIVSVQDFAPEVQRAIGRRQSEAETVAIAARLRGLGLATLDIDHVYGLPHQTCAGVASAARAVAGLAPRRVTVAGYAHVPSIAKRQRMIREEALPGGRERLAQFETAAAAYAAAGYLGIGIDHFAKAGDPLVAAAAEGTMRRGFDGYREDDTLALIGLGAGAVSRLPQGFSQNAAQTRAYIARICAGAGAAERGIALTLEDRVRASAIDMLLCGFRLDLGAIRSTFGDFAALLDDGCAAALRTYRDHVRYEDGVLTIVSDRQVLARLVARLFDVRSAPCGQVGLAV